MVMDLSEVKEMMSAHELATAFRDHNQKITYQVPWLTVAGEPRDSLVHGDVMFGKVSHSDTVNLPPTPSNSSSD